jgi:hypothetical protein
VISTPRSSAPDADIIFTVFADQEKLGELRLSKGNIVWYPANKAYGYTLSWTKLDALAREYGWQS